MLFFIQNSAARSTQNQIGVEGGSRRGNQKKRKGFGNLEDDLSANNKSVQLFDGLKFKNFVLYLAGGANNCIRTSAQKSLMKMEENEYLVEGTKKQEISFQYVLVTYIYILRNRKIDILLDNILVASAVDTNLKTCKTQVFQNALEVLQKSCYSIKVKQL